MINAALYTMGRRFSLFAAWGLSVAVCLDQASVVVECKRSVNPFADGVGQEVGEFLKPFKCFLRFLKGGHAHFIEPPS